MKRPQSYNEAVYEVVHNSGIPIKQLAAQLGIASATLYNCANPNMDEPALARKHIIPLTLATRNFAILDYFEHTCGRIAYELPRVDASFGEVAGEVSNITREFGEVLERIAAALQNDGRIDRTELAAIRQECLDLHRALERLLAVAARDVEA